MLPAATPLSHPRSPGQRPQANPQTITPDNYTEFESKIRTDITKFVKENKGLVIKIVEDASKNNNIKPESRELKDKLLVDLQIALDKSIGYDLAREDYASEDITNDKIYNAQKAQLEVYNNAQSKKETLDRATSLGSNSSPRNLRVEAGAEESKSPASLARLDSSDNRALLTRFAQAQDSEAVAASHAEAKCQAIYENFLYTQLTIKYEDSTYTPMKVAADGNCAFTSLDIPRDGALFNKKYLSLSEENRLNINTLIEKDQVEIQVPLSPADYLKKLGTGSDSITEIAVDILGHLFNLKIELITLYQKTLVSHFHENQGRPTSTALIPPPNRSNAIGNRTHEALEKVLLFAPTNHDGEIPTHFSPLVVDRTSA